MRHLVSCAILFATSAATAAPAIQVHVVPATAGTPPALEVTVRGDDAPLEQLTLVDQASKGTLVATAKRDAKTPLALAIVVQGSEVWVGNDGVLPADDPSRFVGALAPMRKALGSGAFVTGAPAGSQAMLITYGDKATVKAPLGPIANLTARAFGVQKDYVGQRAAELVKGVSLALAELAKAPATARKRVLVIGDGTDVDTDKAKLALGKLALDAAAAHVELGAVIYKGALSDAASPLVAAVPDATVAHEAKAIVAAARDALRGDYVVVFPARAGFPFDGKEHELVLAIGATVTAPVHVLVPAWKP